MDQVYKVCRTRGQNLNQMYETGPDNIWILTATFESMFWSLVSFETLEGRVSGWVSEGQTKPSTGPE